MDGSAPGFAACVGACKTNAQAVKLARELQEKSLYVFLAGSDNGRTMAHQLAEEGVQMGWETRLIPFGEDISAAIFALGFACRAALSFGGVQPGDFARNLRYNKNRIFAFVLALGEINDGWKAGITALMHERANLGGSAHVMLSQFLDGMILAATTRGNAVDPLIRQKIRRLLLRMSIISCT